MTKRILVLDDDLHMVHIVSYKLRQQGYEVLTAHNGRDGYQLACQEKPDLVVTDFQMPIMSGFEMAVKLRENPDTAELPLIMLTARGHKIPPSELAKTNIQSLMAKPFSARELIQNITEQFGYDPAASENDVDNDTGGSHAA